MAILTVLPSSALRPSKGAPEAFLSKGGVPVRTAACSLRAGSGGPAKGPATRLTPCLSGPGEPSPMPPGEPGLISSATAAASVILRASPSPVEFVQRIEKARDKRVAFPSPEFQRLCHEQLDLFRRLVHEDAILSVYVRPAGSYVMDRLELWRVTLHTRMKMLEESDIVVLIGKFCLPAGLRSVEAAMAVQLIEDVPECRALVLPMVKDPFLVGFLVAELPSLDAGQYMEQRSDDPIVHVEAAENKSDNCLDKLEFHPLKKLRRNYFSITSEQKSGAVNISRSLAVAYVMDQHSILSGRPCNVSNVLSELVGVAQPLAHKQQRSLKVKQFNAPLEAAVEEAALRQALSNLIDGALLRTHVGGKVEIFSVEAPGGGALIVVDDDGPDMHYMTQMYSLAPFGAELSSQGMVEDSMTWNFVAGLTVAREILESYGCVVRIISPHLHNTSLGAGGTRVELWLPALRSEVIDPSQSENQQ